MKKSAVVFAVLFLFVLAGCGQAANGGAVVIKVNDKKITEGDIQAKIDAVPAEYRMMMQSPDAKKRLIDQLVLTELILQEAEKTGVLADKEVQGKIKETETSMKKDVETQISALNKQKENISKDAKERVIINNMLSKTVYPGITISNAELKAGYAEYSKQMKARDPRAKVPSLKQIEKDLSLELAKRKWVNSLKSKANITMTEPAPGIPPVSIPKTTGKSIRLAPAKK